MPFFFLYFVSSSLDAIHIAAREGARDDLLKQLDSGVSVNLKGFASFCFLNIAELCALSAM